MTWRKWIGIFSWLFASLSAPTWAEVESWQWLDSLAEESMEDWEVPGMALAVVKDGKLAYAKGYGKLNLEQETPCNASSIFAGGSTTKAITAMSLSILVHEGKISWDSRVVDLLPGFQFYDAYTTQELRVRDLLCHRTGLGANAGDPLVFAFDRDGLVERLRYMTPAHGFRAEFAYQSMTFVVAGKVVEQVSGMPWDQFVQERIFQPLGMDRTGTLTAQRYKLENQASPHVKLQGKVLSSQWPVMDTVGPGGSIFSTAEDMSRWVQALLGNGKLDGEQVFPAGAVEDCFVSNIVVPAAEGGCAFNPHGFIETYGLGWYVRDHHGHRLCQHGGNIPGMSARVMLLPDLNLGVVVLTNKDRVSITNAICMEIVDHELGYNDHAWKDEILAASHAEKAQKAQMMAGMGKARRTDTTPSHPLSAYAGTYTDVLFGHATVQDLGSSLLLKYGPAIEAELTHFHFDTFLLTWRSPLLQGYQGSALVTFGLDHFGRIEGFNVMNLLRFKKVA